MARQIPRSFWILTLLAAAAAAWLWRSEDVDGARSLLPFPGRDVSRLVVEGGGRTVTLQRDGEGWSLHGPDRDFVEPGAVDDVVNALAAVLCTAEELPPDPAYGLDASGALRVAVSSSDGRNWAGVLGVINPLTEGLYVSDEATGGIHLAEPGIRARLERLPDSIRLRRLWPFEPAEAETVVVRQQGREPWRFTRDALQRWWWTAIPEALPSGTPAAAYQADWSDRRRRDGGGRAWLADDRRLRNLLTALSDAPVLAFHPGERSPLGEDGRTAPIALEVVAGDDRGRFLLGGVSDDTRLDVWRRPARRGLQTRLAPREVAEAPLVDWLHGDVLTHRLATADSFALELTEMGSVRAHRTVVGPGETRGPGDWTPERGGRAPDVHLGDLAHLIDRLAMLTAPRLVGAAAEVFRDGPRLTLTTWQRGPGLPPRQIVEIGVSRDGTAVLGYRPQDGFVAEVPSSLLISGRNYLRGR